MCDSHGTCCTNHFPEQCLEPRSGVRIYCYLHTKAKEYFNYPIKLSQQSKRETKYQSSGVK